MKILGIETSCDETAAAVVENGTKVINSVVASSIDLHIKTGGIIPEKAAREQVKSMIPVLKEALINTKVKDVDAIAVTVGPGLIGSLLVGVETARTLAYLWQKPIIPINHLKAHLYANWLDTKKPPQFPAVVLVVSGGHTDLILMENHNHIKWLGGTRDDAAGEAFDKCARLLGLPYPGGPSIAKAASEFKEQKPKVKLPRPMMVDDNYDFSFSGLKTAVLREVQNNKDNHLTVEEIAFETQEAIVDCLITKTIKSVKSYKPKSLLLAGGVAANNHLRERFEAIIKQDKLEVKFYCPKLKDCTDNAAAIAACAFFNNQPVDWQQINTNPELTINTQL